ncbi:hypothetical protein [Bifidobacterium callitrichidarum]|uniref:Uncharacterized protein n=1 Tax=Bifidobacterium callitrichidarum TaxID=2052941 RepID=A0A2U2N8Y3_9BIFI|nr:hypothetical protein [Bifidobacterium callitrichidarum]PWG65626.1 hypothetical protein DF196_06750 [Bifidobacterium callitrichidarum]
MKRFKIKYYETYVGEFTVELGEDATEEDALHELLDHADEYRLSQNIDLTDSDAKVIDVETSETIWKRGHHEQA